MSLYMHSSNTEQNQNREREDQGLQLPFLHPLQLELQLQDGLQEEDLPIFPLQP
ncbi:hypothetical protein BT69DRAFT_1287605 [Atractiella rhizophila]|nr:hypothetical protein BT69DRAFT_1287605 [Atractiella rhizophila]